MVHESLKNKIDFAVIIRVEKANPNGDPLGGNAPRQTYDGSGEITGVCLKRKLRNRLQDMGETIFVQPDNNRTDEYRSLNDRFKSAELGEDIQNNACEKWMDVRAFGQVFAFKKNDSKEGANSVSIGIRGPVSIHSAYSLEPIVAEHIQITKSVNLETDKKNPAQRGSDTIGSKYRVDKGIYVTYGSINSQLASKTGFSDEDAEKIKNALRSLFVNDSSSARPEGSMEVMKVIWWKHDCTCGQYSAAKVHRSLVVHNDGTYTLNKLEDLIPEELDELEGKELEKLRK